MSQKDYEEYEGEEIVFYIDGNKYYGIVTGCDKDVGISIQNKNNMDEYLCCLCGPSSPQFSPIWNDKHQKEFDFYFKTVIGFIEKGELTSEKLKAMNIKMEGERFFL